MLEYAHKEFFYALAVLPILVAVYFLALYLRKKAIKRFGETAIFKKLTSDSSLSKKNLKFILALAGLAFLIIALIDPETGAHPENINTSGSDIVITLDVSNSMNAQDIMPSRLERAKEAIEQLINKLQGDRIGIVIFAGQSIVQLPITTDYNSAKLFLSEIKTDLIPVQGTAIGEALDRSANLLSGETDSTFSKRSKSIILISDGENFEDDALAAAREAAAKGIVIHTIGIGSPDGVPIPIETNGKLSGYKKDKDGNTVITKLNIGLLESIALSTNGICVQATSSDLGLDKVVEQIGKMKKANVTIKRYRDHNEHFMIFIFIALLLLIIDIFVTENKTKWYQQLNLFGKSNEK
ncbi:MAG TPA: VWA domain-containing protein [Bacteroidia bacterium]|nr:VWA domain-containing protein [Bacteroidia bacterium]